MNKTQILTGALLILFNAYQGFAQENTLGITGQASRSLKPTETVVSFNIARQATSYQNTLNLLSKDVDVLVSALKKSGFNPGEIITNQFNISKKKKYVNGSWKDEGFQGTQEIKVTFKNDRERLVRILNSTTASGSQPEINISFRLDRETRESVKNELLAEAVKNGRKKAALIAEAAGVKIMGVQTINYGITNAPPIPQPNYRMAENSLGAADAADFGPMEAQSITLFEKVDLIFQIQE